MNMLRKLSRFGCAAGAAGGSADGHGFCCDARGSDRVGSAVAENHVMSLRERYCRRACAYAYAYVHHYESLASNPKPQECLLIPPDLMTADQPLVGFCRFKVVAK